MTLPSRAKMQKLFLSLMAMTLTPSPTSLIYLLSLAKILIFSYLKFNKWHPTSEQMRAILNPL